MLSSFCVAWNSLYSKHPSEYKTGSITIIEKDNNAKNKSLTVICDEAISFPSKQLDCYDLFSALTNKNCDGALLIKNEEGSYDFVYLEMKSRFDSRECFEAKCQITESRAKMKSMFMMMKRFAMLPIRKIIGVIEYQQLDQDQENLWLKVQQLPDDRLDFGWKLIKYGMFNCQTHYNNEMNMPDTMTFILLLSDNADITVNYSDILKRTLSFIPSV